MVIGDKEAASGVASLKLLATGKQMEVPLPMLRDTVMAVIGKIHKQRARDADAAAAAASAELEAAAADTATDSSESE